MATGRVTESGWQKLVQCLSLAIAAVVATVVATVVANVANVIFTELFCMVAVTAIESK